MTLQLGLVITERCNIGCSHCLFGASKSTERSRDISIANIKHYIDQVGTIANQTKQPFSVSFTGGEPFLIYPELIEGIRHARDRGSWRISTVTNGFWGSEESYAQVVAKELEAAGLSDIAFSMDDFHQKHIPLASVYQAIGACGETSITISIKTSVTKKTSRLPEILFGLADVLLGQKVVVQEIPCVPEGRAQLEISPEDFLYEDQMPNKPCDMGLMMVILPDGSVFPCCGTGWNQRLFLGNARNTDLDILFHRMTDTPLLMLLREKGPYYLANSLEQAGYSLSECRYIGNCDLCKTVLTHPALEEVLPDTLHKWRVERVQRLLGEQVL